MPPVFRLPSLPRQRESASRTRGPIAAWAIPPGPQSVLRQHAVALFWTFTLVVASVFVVSVARFCAQQVLVCPEGTELVGGAPPEHFEAYCAIEGTDGVVRHGPYRKWHATTSAYKGSRLMPDVRVEGAYDFSERVGTWTVRWRSGAIRDQWQERTAFDDASL